MKMKLPLVWIFSFNIKILYHVKTFIHIINNSCYDCYMNIFILDHNTKLSAQYHVDRHVVKMPLESTQLLCSAFYSTGQDELAQYKKTHFNHPCAIWARESLSNWVWLYDFALELCKEYTHRYGKHHACEGVINNMGIPNLKDIGITEFPQAMPEQYRGKDVVMAYRQYYNGEKKDLFAWKNREAPYWIEVQKG